MPRGAEARRYEPEPELPQEQPPEASSDTATGTPAPEADTSATEKLLREETSTSEFLRQEEAREKTERIKEAEQVVGGEESEASEFLRQEEAKRKTEEIKHAGRVLRNPATKTAKFLKEQAAQDAASEPATTETPKKKDVPTNRVLRNPATKTAKFLKAQGESEAQENAEANALTKEIATLRRGLEKAKPNERKTIKAEIARKEAELAKALAPTEEITPDIIASEQTTAEHAEEERQKASAAERGRQFAELKKRQQAEDEQRAAEALRQVRELGEETAQATTAAKSPKRGKKQAAPDILANVGPAETLEEEQKAADRKEVQESLQELRIIEADRAATEAKDARERAKALTELLDGYQEYAADPDMAAKANEFADAILLYAEEKGGEKIPKALRSRLEKTTASIIAGRNEVQSSLQELRKIEADRVAASEVTKTLEEIKTATAKAEKAKTPEAVEEKTPAAEAARTAEETGTERKLSFNERVALIQELIDKGNEVIVKRRNGKFQKGWVSNFFRASGSVDVAFNDPESGKVLEKGVDPEEFLSWQEHAFDGLKVRELAKDGDEVWVKRSNGTLEKGTLAGLDDEGREVKVFFPNAETGRVLTKTIDAAEFLAWQNEGGALKKEVPVENPAEKGAILLTPEMVKRPGSESPEAMRVRELDQEREDLIDEALRLREDIAKRGWIARNFGSSTEKARLKEIAKRQITLEEELGQARHEAGPELPALTRPSNAGESAAIRSRQRRQDIDEQFPAGSIGRGRGK